MKRNMDGRRLRAGLVGGGRGAFIGAVHRMAVELDGEAEVVAGALSADPQTARASAAAWHLQRSYDSYQEMARAEAARADGIDFAIVATPNHLHYPVARAFLEKGIPVVCDKPLAHSLPDAEALVQVVERTGLLFALTHNYTGYPMVREARERIRRGEIGELRKVVVEYHQDWLKDALDPAANKQAAWRVDPNRAGMGGCIADIGSHAQHLLEYIAGRKIASLCADLTRFVPGRLLDDDANILLRLEGGGKGTLSCSQVACGEENALGIRIYGSKAGLEWHQQEPNTLLLKPAGEPWRRLRTGGSQLSAEGQQAARLPAGHPEGYLEAFAVLYRAVIADLRRAANGQGAQGGYPTVHDGLRGMRFIAAAVESSAQGGRWFDL
ncbi:MAG TPA: Gfo/Idh/MocA family oxidoreductase [Steroidobacteraceae bacterium]|nr:Gfo/Idh/MocA family oxidoreductase [Steroidobacteraceae bacterium]